MLQALSIVWRNIITAEELGDMNILRHHESVSVQTLPTPSLTSERFSLHFFLVKLKLQREVVSMKIHEPRTLMT